MMRDDPMDAALPDAFEPSPHYAQRVAETKAKIAELRQMSTAEASRVIEAERERVTAQNAEWRAAHEVKTERYAVIRAQVAAWAPPSHDHQELKAFMLSQIDQCTRGDSCYQEPLPEPDPAFWLFKRLADLKDDLNYREKSLAAELERVRGRNMWVSVLRASVPEPAA